LQSDIQGSLEQFVQVVHPLNQLERNTDQKELSQLIEDIAAGAKEHRDVREEATASDYNVENVPPICPETSPAEPIEAHNDVYHVHNGDEDKKIICAHPIRKKRTTPERLEERHTLEIINQAPWCEGLRPEKKVRSTHQLPFPLRTVC
jgi:hypothetical protein